MNRNFFIDILIQYSTIAILVERQLRVFFNLSLIQNKILIDRIEINITNSFVIKY